MTAAIILAALVLQHRFEVVINWQVQYLIAFATVCVAAGGNLINDVIDFEIDRIAKPHRWVSQSESNRKLGAITAWVLMGLGAVSGFLAAHLAGLSLIFGAIPLACAILLLVYSKWLQHLPWFGNIIVSALTGLVVIMPVLFELDSTKNSWSIMSIFAGLAFLSSMIREIAKDAEDRSGDRLAATKSIGGTWDTSAIKKVLFGFTLLLFPISIKLMPGTHIPGKIWGIILMCGYTVLLFSIWKLNGESTASDFKVISFRARLIMAGGLLWMLFYITSMSPN
jgi:4-hydroxybenzoate polyprenyltransferase